MKILTIIPARMAATRLPNKPLADIHGVPMIVRVMKQAEKAGIGPVIVACDGEEIKTVVEAHGGVAVMTDPALPSGTDRAYAAADIFDPQGIYDLIINVQGDQPNLNPDDLKTMATFMSQGDHDITTIAALSKDHSDRTNLNVIKIAMNDTLVGTKTQAYYFSRSCIPSEAKNVYHHIGVYGYKRRVLKQFVNLAPSYLEQSERLEQLRALEAGMRIDVVVVNSIPQSVDTPEDLEKVKGMIAA
ncbi:MAG: 3-deoxy-manno-octulosonate cytidylyltransferase [Alphaproteobacteria bacterium]|nr:3-deoxy-manno-octulosonate cytidylyltransferase [Alphaproteobacteria bacterium]